jgi:Glyoxalase-like domain
MTGVDGVDRRLPAGDEIFLDHVAHFVADADAAAQALAQAGFTTTPRSIQVNPDAGGGPPQPTGTGNVTAMLDRGYIEFLFKTADTPLAKQFDIAMARYRGLHLVAFAVADAAGTHARLATAGFALQPVVDMQRPVETPDGAGVAAFSIVRLQSGEMPEGRIQALTHRTEATVWQQRWLSHRNGATGLIDVAIVEPDVGEAAARFARFLGRPAAFDRFGQSITLDRGRVQFMTSLMLAETLPGLEIPAMPFICAYGIAVHSLAAAAVCLDAGGIAFTRRAGCLVAAFPAALGDGCWAFVEEAAALPWRGG